ncbi:MAG: hypothetical protein ACI9P5_000160 [Saprospiraceae bacterium]|jgi:hypothetical protein
MYNYNGVKILEQRECFHHGLNIKILDEQARRSPKESIGWKLMEKVICRIVKK